MVAQNVAWEISLIGLSVSLFALINVIIKPEKHKADICFCFWLFLLNMPMIHAVVEHIHVVTEFTREYFNISFSLLNGPLLYLYTLLLIQDKLNIRWLHLLHLIPFAVFYVLFIRGSFPSPLLPSPETWLPQLKPPHLPPPPIEGSDHLALSLMMLMKKFGTVHAVLFLIYSFYTIRLLNQHRQKISEYYSHNDNRISLKWIYALPTLFAVLVLINLLNEQPDGQLPTIFPLSLHLFSYLLFIVLLCIFGVKQTPVFKADDTAADEKNDGEVYKEAPCNSPKDLDIGPDEKEGVKHHSDDLIETVHLLKSEELINDESTRELIERMRAYMESEKPYLEPTFTVYELSQALDVPRRTLSHVLSHGLSKNFFQFVNEYRVEEVKGWLHKDIDKKTTLLEIALKSGFNSKTTFNCFFKQHCGVTPSQYRKKIIQDRVI